MKLSIPFIRLAAALLLGANLSFAAAQSLDAATVPVVGDKWTFRFENKGDKKEPFNYSLKATAADEKNAWLFGESSEANTRWPKYVWRQDVASAQGAERFEFDAAAANGAGKRIVDRSQAEKWLQFPLVIGKKYKVSFPWSSGEGVDEMTAEVQALEKVKVEAGEFDAYRIEYSGFWNRRVGNNAAGRIKHVVWYAPEAKAFARWHYTNRTSSGGPWNDTTTELVKWEPSNGK